MNRQDIIESRSRGEAHLYTAVAKSDGFVSTKEKARAPAIAYKCKTLFDALNISKETKELVFKYTKQILEDSSYNNWTSDQHLDEAINHLKIAKKLGDTSISYIADNCESALQDLAVIDGYLLKESRFLSKIKKLLSEID